MVDEYSKQRKVYIDPKTEIEYESIVGGFTHKRIGNDQLEAVDKLPEGCVLKEDYKEEVIKKNPEEKATNDELEPSPEDTGPGAPQENEEPNDSVPEEPTPEEVPRDMKEYRKNLKALNKKEQIKKIYELSEELPMTRPDIPYLEDGRIDLIIELEKKVEEQKNAEGNGTETEKDN